MASLIFLSPAGSPPVTRQQKLAISGEVSQEGPVLSSWIPPHVMYITRAVASSVCIHRILNNNEADLAAARMHAASRTAVSQPLSGSSHDEHLWRLDLLEHLHCPQSAMPQSRVTSRKQWSRQGTEGLRRAAYM